MTYALDAKADITTEARNFGLDGLQFVARTPAGRLVPGRTEN